MPEFELIEQKRYKDFCDLYLEETQLQGTESQGGKLAIMGGNYMLALLGTRNFDDLICISQQLIEEEHNKATKYDMSVSKYFIGLSIGHLKRQEIDVAAQAIRAGTQAAYQDISRTQAPCIMYYEAVITGNEQLKRESKKILNARLRSKGAFSANYAAAKILMGKIDVSEAIFQTNTIEKSILRARQMVQVLFYSAVKSFEQGEKESCVKYLQQASDVYNECVTVTLEVEFYLAEIWLDEFLA